MTIQLPIPKGVRDKLVRAGCSSSRAAVALFEYVRDENPNLGQPTPAGRPGFSETTPSIRLDLPDNLVPPSTNTFDGLLVFGTHLSAALRAYFLRNGNISWPAMPEQPQVAVEPAVEEVAFCIDGAELRQILRKLGLSASELVLEALKNFAGMPTPLDGRVSNRYGIGGQDVFVRLPAAVVQGLPLVGSARNERIVGAVRRYAKKKGIRYDPS